MVPYIAILAFVILCCVIFRISYKIHTDKLLEEYQLEWDKIKQQLVDDGKKEAEILDKHAEYIEYLWYTRHPKYGACFPHY